MGVVREFFCPGHGSFEAETPNCPRGCSIPVAREFLTAPAVHGGMTSKTDALIRSQVEAFGLSNIRSAREGETSRIPDPKVSQMAQFQKAIRQKYPRMWGSLPSGENAIPSTLSAHHAEPTTGIDRAALAANAPRVERIRDPENLKIA